MVSQPKAVNLQTGKAGSPAGSLPGPAVAPASSAVPALDIGQHAGDTPHRDQGTPRQAAVAAGDREVGRQNRQRMRSIAIALALGGLVVLFYVATIVRLGGNVFNRSL